MDGDGGKAKGGETWATRNFDRISASTNFTKRINISLVGSGNLCFNGKQLASTSYCVCKCMLDKVRINALHIGDGMYICVLSHNEYIFPFFQLLFCDLLFQMKC